MLEKINTLEKKTKTTINRGYFTNMGLNTVVQSFKLLVNTEQDCL